jgi:hypothetical protein
LKLCVGESHFNQAFRIWLENPALANFLSSAEVAGGSCQLDE